MQATHHYNHRSQVSHFKLALGSAHALIRHLRLLSPDSSREGADDDEGEGVEGTYELSLLTLRDCLQYDAAAARCVRWCKYLCIGRCTCLEGRLHIRTPAHTHTSIYTSYGIIFIHAHAYI